VESASAAPQYPSSTWSRSSRILIPGDDGLPANLTWIANYIWGVADDVLRDFYVRGRYRDIILPITVLRRLDAVLEPTKQAAT
jgi:type I restriction enzyme M protein